jgi:hypothetical protein
VPPTMCPVSLQLATPFMPARKHACLV